MSSTSQPSVPSLPEPLRPDQKCLETTIGAVMVYPNQALITRRATVTLTGEESELIVPNLPPSLKLQSLRAGGSGTAQVKVLSVETEKLSADPNQLARLDTLKQQQQHFEEQYRQIKDHIASLQLQRDFIQGLSERSIETYAQSLAQQQIDLPQTQAMLTFLGDRHQHFSQAIAQQEQTKYQIDHQLQATRDEIQAQQKVPTTSGYRAMIRIRTTTPGDYTLELSYRVTQASWAPLYDVRFDPANPELTLTYLAIVRQDSGEDWSQVELTLSTAKPSLNLAPPELSPWLVESPRPMMGKGSGSKSAKVSAGSTSNRGGTPLLEAYRMLGAMPGTEISPTAQQLERDGNSRDLNASRPIANFPMVAPVTITSDNQGHSVTILSQLMVAQLTYIVLPQRVNIAYLRAALRHDAEAPPLLPGNVNLFRQSVFIGTAWLDYIAPEQAFSLDLGAEEQIQIKRILTKRELETLDQNRHTLAFDIEVSNRLKNGAMVQVIEQLPISRNPKIQIQVDTLEPPTTVDEAGMCQWQLHLEAGEQTCLSYQFTVDHPGDVTVVGLDR